jgi:hypothetical protein
MPNDPAAPPVKFRVFHLPPGSTLRDAAEKLSRLDPDLFRIPDAFAYVFEEAVEDVAAEVASVTSYESKRPHYVVDRFQEQERIRRVDGNRLIPVEPSTLRAKIREADLLDLMMSDGSLSVLEPGGNYHFVTPSLMHTDRFIRIGDLVRNRAGLDRLVFWLESAVRGVGGVLVDTWSISAVLLRAMQRLKLDVPFDCLPEHPAQNPEGCQAVVQDLVQRMEAGSKLLVVVSISGGGHLVKKIENELKQIGGDVLIEALSIYGFTSTPGDITCMARIDDKGVTEFEGSCTLCAGGSVAIPIDSSSYHIRSWREELVMTGERHFDPAKDFIEAYRDEDGLFFVHRDDPADSRHHAFDIDVRKLLEVPRFAEKHRRIVDQFTGKVDLIVAPNHDVAARLQELASGVLGAPCVTHDTLDRRDVAQAEAERLVAAQRILIVDDTLNSGSRIHRYIQSLREGDYGGFKSIDAHVCLARPESEAELRRLSGYISNRHPWSGAVHCTEVIFLPRWGRDKCPWCKEFDRLSKLEESFGRPPAWLTERLRCLRNTLAGITEDPLLLLPGYETPVLGDGSVVCSVGASAIVAVFAIASGLQQHRWDPDFQQQLHPDFPLANVLSPKIFERYTEGLIRAIILRTATRHELGWQAGIASRDFLLGQLAQENQKILAGEIIAALGRRSFPAISASRFVSAFGSFLSNEELTRLATALDLP